MNKVSTINQKLIKRKLLELAIIKRKLEFEKKVDRDIIRDAITHKLESDILNLKDINKEYGFSTRTIYRYRARGLKFAKSSSRGFVFVIRKDLENFLKKNLYD
ncbi:hypothetical protein MW871_11290 [Flavobacterium sp. I-SCBP12n]|uniref:Helix-turn-helix domain-containing protein n=1 Tax=Flavobacterium pygoscelis TaxID=2893176 RepID=A0A9X1XTN1_9FLAO|nr:hypothetical protein [Flavobacterium pygoscelis]MCK8142476.1 hypothetical protein [Flavobacterium pygoscelis]